ncbi:MAG: hypothetical protein L6309_02335 [Candidatus Omnitrophica bacterium]|nr:hypothetical protein [Candidatus Omnitrophota bacterium]
MKICKKCVMPENFPHVTFDKNGICNFCRDFQGRQELKRLQKVYKKKFEAVIKANRGRNEYDILMCYSGGKDSTHALSILKNVYKLKILALTFDNGFVPERTYVNIRNVVEKLNVDHIFFKPRFDILKKIFVTSARRSLYPSKSLERAGTICTSCIGLVKYISLKLAIEKEVPLIAFGWSPGQAPITSSILQINPRMINSMEKILKVPMERIVGKDIDVYFLSERHYAKPEKFPIFVHPLALFDYNEKKILKAIERFGWKRPTGVELNATNCYLNLFADEAHIARYKFHPYILEIANFVREGYMTRGEGLRHLPLKKNQKIVRMVKRKLGIQGR